jgi:translation initiation factor 2B subunit (eIF-2B alpha/beta/delta family)
MRDPNEIHKPIKGMKIVNPAFDESDYKYISKIITEKGILEPKELLRELRR